MIGRQVHIDMETEINILKHRIEDLEGEYLFWHKQIMHKDKKPVAGLDKCVMRINKIVEDVEEYRYLLRNKEEMLKRIEEEMSKYSDLGRRVMYMHRVEKKTLKEIANELGYSYIWIRQVYSRARKTTA